LASALRRKPRHRGWNRSHSIERASSTTAG
jgi:hypothetical protein